jgi:hypothetical protein
MTEKHYAHLAPSYVADTIRAHFPTLGIAGDSYRRGYKAEGDTPPLMPIGVLLENAAISKNEN